MTQYDIFRTLTSSERSLGLDLYVEKRFGKHSYTSHPPLSDYPLARTIVDSLDQLVRELMFGQEISMVPFVKLEEDAGRI